MIDPLHALPNLLADLVLLRTSDGFGSIIIEAEPGSVSIDSVCQCHYDTIGLLAQAMLQELEELGADGMAVDVRLGKEWQP